MIDCKITKNYLKEKDRMCEIIVCEDCVFYDYAHCTPNKVKDMQKCIDGVQAWSDAHPIKTYLSDFLEKYPNAPMFENGCPKTCPKNLGYGKDKCPVETDCFGCWNRPYEE